MLGVLGLQVVCNDATVHDPFTRFQVLGNGNRAGRIDLKQPVWLGSKVYVAFGVGNLLLLGAQQDTMTKRACIVGGGLRHDNAVPCNAQSRRVEVLGSPLTQISSLALAMVQVEMLRRRDARGVWKAQHLTLRRGTAVNMDEAG